MSRNEFDNIFVSETKSYTGMKNMTYFLISNILLVALLLLASCGRNDEDRDVQATTVQTTSFRLVIADSSAKTRLHTKDTSSSRTKASGKSTDDLIRWSSYSTLNGN